MRQSLHKKLRELVEIARIEAEYAKADLSLSGAGATSPMRHIKGAIERLDEVLALMTSEKDGRPDASADEEFTRGDGEADDVED
jgi:hypothetical protein